LLRHDDGITVDVDIRKNALEQIRHAPARRDPLACKKSRLRQQERASANQYQRPRSGRRVTGPCDVLRQASASVFNLRRAATTIVSMAVLSNAAKGRVSMALSSGVRMWPPCGLAI
jgi:hypothetical protein